MRKYIIISIVFISLVGCKKAELDLYPFNQIETTKAFNTENDANLAVNGMYAGLRTSGSFYQGSWTVISDVTSDNLIINTVGRLSQKVYHNWQYASTNEIGLFSGGYSLTRRANAILENIDKVPTSSPDYINNVKGQALAFRAMVLLDMARAFSKPYQTATANDVAIPYVTSTDRSLKPAGEPVKDFYDKVVKDLTQAVTLINTSNGVGRLSKAAVNGILSRAYLYKSDWANCITASTAALGATPVLPDIANFRGVWKDSTEAGVLFKTKNTITDNVNTLGVNYYQTVAGGIKSEYVVDYEFRKLFLSNDIRTSVYIQTSAYNGVAYNHIIKWAGKTGFPAGVLDAKVIRTAEVLLNRAEAYYKNNDQVNALKDLNLLKKNRYISYVDTVLANQPLLDEIYLQRRLELAFEGDRFWDLKRRNLPVQRSNYGDYADGTGTNYVFKTLPAGDFKFQFPIPQSELNFNTNLKQNPGYN